MTDADVRPAAAIEAVWKRIAVRCVWINGCFVWQGSKGRGYGQIRAGDKRHQVHRIAYEYANGPIPDGFTIDHVKARGCWSKACCNAAHLEAVTNAVNIRRGDSGSARNARKTHCIRGHELSGQNLITRGLRLGWRWCRQCKNEDRRRRLAAARRVMRRETEASDV